MKKWLLFELSYLTQKSPRRNFVEFISDSEVGRYIPQSFWGDEGPSLEIFELTPDGEKKKRPELSEPFLEKQRDNHMRNIS